MKEDHGMNEGTEQRLDDIKSQDRIRIKTIKPKKGIPGEIRIDLEGNVYIDGELFSEEESPYPCLSVDVQSQKKFNAGEETQKMIEKSKTAKRGERVIIKDIRGPEKSETTRVKF